MNLWKNIEKEPPELNKGVLVTDGASVYFGQFTSENVFEGVDTSGFMFLAMGDGLRRSGITEYCYYGEERSV